MLVLSRKLGERIYIGDSIVVTVVDIDRGKVRLGIEAPRDIEILRDNHPKLLAQQNLALLKRQGEDPNAAEGAV